jgi:hypothetical protein
MQHDPVIFTSWKEIASYLGKGVRTVQRWEAQFGLPVQRPNARAKGIVRASREDLDRWMATRWSSRSAKIEIPISVSHRNPAGPKLDSGIQVSRELHIAHLRLVDELQESLRALSEKCQGLALHLDNSRSLGSDPAINLPKNGNGAKATNPQ